MLEKPGEVPNTCIVLATTTCTTTTAAATADATTTTTTTTTTTNATYTKIYNMMNFRMFTLLALRNRCTNKCIVKLYGHSISLLQL